MATEVYTGLVVTIMHQLRQRGFSSREIARICHVSPRTVLEYTKRRDGSSQINSTGAHPWQKRKLIPTRSRN